MIARLWNLVQRGRRDQPPRHLRPNELRRGVVRAERLRREALATRPVLDRQQRSPEEQQPRRPPVAPPQATTVTAERFRTAALRSRSGLRQALLLKEILDPPVALRDRHLR
ncbi:MAG: hypothetical protein H0V00_11785 [Chloroflexia bacterium]|nr:hypothetical protein [Chloroflexia bacterium]